MSDKVRRWIQIRNRVVRLPRQARWTVSRWWDRRHPRIVLSLDRPVSADQLTEALAAIDNVRLMEVIGVDIRGGVLMPIGSRSVMRSCNIKGVGLVGTGRDTVISTLRPRGGS